MDFLRKHTRTIFIITIIGFLAGVFIGFGAYFREKGAPTDAVAKINGVKIPFKKYQSLYTRVMDNLRESNTDITDLVVQQKRQEVLQDLIQEEVFWQEAAKYGILVTDKELAATVQSFPAFQKDGRFDQQVYFQMLFYRLRMTPQEFEESQKRRIAMFKIRDIVISGLKITEQEVQFEYFMEHQGNMKKYEKDRDEFLKKLQNEKTLALLNDWYKTLSNSIKVQVFPEHFQ